MLLSLAIQEKFGILRKGEPTPQKEPSGRHCGARPSACVPLLTAVLQLRASHPSPTL